MFSLREAAKTSYSYEKVTYLIKSHDLGKEELNNILLIAINNEDIKMVKLLIKNGADIMRCIKKLTLYPEFLIKLYKVLVKLKNYQVLKYLLGKHPTAVTLFVKLNNEAGVSFRSAKMLAKTLKRMDANQDFIKLQEYRVIKAFIKYKSKFNYGSSLRYCITKNKHRCVELLLPYYTESMDLHHPIMFGAKNNIKIVKLLSKVVNPNTFRRLIFNTNNFSVVQFLVNKCNVPVNIRNMNCETPLHVFCRLRKPWRKFFRDFLTHTDTTLSVKMAVNEYRKKSLKNTIKIVQFLIDKCPNAIHITNKKGCSPLHIATENNNIEIVKLLLKYRVNVHNVLTRSKAENIIKNFNVYKLLFEHVKDELSINTLCKAIYYNEGCSEIVRWGIYKYGKRLEEKIDTDYLLISDAVFEGYKYVSDDEVRRKEIYETTILPKVITDLIADYSKLEPE